MTQEPSSAARDTGGDVNRDTLRQLHADLAAEPPYRIALRPDDRGELDDVVVNDVEMYRAEMMDDRSLWMCCYLKGHERVNFWVTVKGRGTLEFRVTEQPHDVVYEDGSL